MYITNFKHLVEPMADLGSFVLWDNSPLPLVELYLISIEKHLQVKTRPGQVTGSTGRIKPNHLSNYLFLLLDNGSVMDSSRHLPVVTF